MSLPSRLTLLLVAAIVAVNVYRAATQSITIDEAFTYQHFVAPPLHTVMTTYDVNHHVLNSLLAKLTTALFGVSEITLRMPSLLGGLIYLLAVRAIVLYVFSAEWAMAAFALLSLNPFVLDHLVAARGYGLALAFLMCALWSLLRSRWYPAGFCCGLAIASNLAFLVPVGALCALAAGVDANRKNFGQFLDRVVVPAAALPFVLYVFPLSRADAWQFAFGSPTVMAALESYIVLSLLDKRPPFEDWVVPVFETIAILIVASSALAWAVIFRKRDRSPVERLILLNGGALLLSLAVTWLSHVTVRAGYPHTRTGLYWPVLLSLGGVALIYRFARVRALRWSALGLVALCVVQFVNEFRVGYFGEWRFDAGSKRIAAVILQNGGRGNLRVACSPILPFSLDYYRTRYGAQWQILGDPKAEAAFHVLKPEDFRPELKVLYHDPVSDVVLTK